jgi:hypothetical protein
MNEETKERSQFRQNSVVGTNGPTEGASLINYFTNTGFEAYEAHVKSPYQAFIGCFTFNLDSLNQFRLYGKTGDQEGTGLSMVFKSNFFSDKDDAINSTIASYGNFLQNNDSKKEIIKNDEIGRPSLYRCIYIDPVKKHIISLGQKDITSFYDGKTDEEAEKAFQKYQKEKNKTKKEIQKLFRVMEDTIKKLKVKDHALLTDLLINLRYLVKHYAFKEEQECRILTVKIPSPGDIKLQRDEKNEINRMYIEIGDVSGYIDKIYFGPCAAGIELFHDRITYEGLDIPCEESNLPFAGKK